MVPGDIEDFPKSEVSERHVFTPSLSLPLKREGTESYSIFA